MASSMQDEEVLHRMEPELDQADLNKEAKHEDDDGKIVASETSEAEKKKIMEQEVKDANQEEERRREAKAREDDARIAAILLSISGYEEDDSEQTLTFLTRWQAQETPPENIIHGSLVEQCSRPVQKQLTTSDVKQNKLSLPRKKFQQLLDESEAWHGRKETRFSVYGPDGKVHEMWLCGKNRSSLFELTTGWWTFVEEYGLKECCDFVTVWMFRHRVTQQICLAIDTTRFGFRKQVSKRISDAAFEDSD